jgi:NADH dehydrogenase
MPQTASFLRTCLRSRTFSTMVKTRAMAKLAPERGNVAPALNQWDKTRVLILGSGWAGYVLSRKLDPKKHHITIVSPRSYLVFTPLLNDTVVGTLDFANVIEPVRDRYTSVEFVQGWARQVDFHKRFVRVEGSVTEKGVTEGAAIDGSADKHPQGKGAITAQEKKETNEDPEDKVMEVPYDQLVIAVGCNPQTFGTPGVKDNAFFLKDIGDARKIRRRILECFELAAASNCTEEKKKQLLHFAVVGGGPTGMEFAGVLADLIHEDLMKVYPSLKGYGNVTVYDVADDVLGMFDEALSKYAKEHMQKQGVSIKTGHHIEELRWGMPGKPAPDGPDPRGPLTIKTKEQGEEGCGMCVWVTGNAMNPFVEMGLNEIKEIRAEDLIHDQGETPDAHVASWQIKKHEKTNALLVDDWLRVQLSTNDGFNATLRNVFAMGDNCMIESGPPPPTGETADQESKWLAKHMNAGDFDTCKPFEFKDKGLIAYVGDSKGLSQSTGDKSDAGPTSNNIAGRTAYLGWRASYWHQSLSWRNRILILVYWAVNTIFGRDISRF